MRSPARLRVMISLLAVLSVNVKNPVAIRTYQRAGFADSDRLYFGGAAGPQHVFELWL